MPNRSEVLKPIRPRPRRVLPVIRGPRTLQTNSTAWRKLRESWLSRHPFCEDCAAKVPPVIKMATEVDHKDEDATNNDESNFSSKCKPCHSRKTRLSTIANRGQEHGRKG